MTRSIFSILICRKKIKQFSIDFLNWKRKENSFSSSLISIKLINQYSLSPSMSYSRVRGEIYSFPISFFMKYSLTRSFYFLYFGFLFQISRKKKIFFHQRENIKFQTKSTLFFIFLK